MAFVFMGAEQVLSGDVVSGLTISQNDPIDAAIVADGGIIVSAVVSDFGQTGLELGGEAFGTTVLAGGVASGGVSIDPQVTYSGWELIVSGGVSSDAQIVGDLETVSFGGLTVGTTVGSGVLELEPGFDTSIGGKQVVYAGGMASGTFAVSSGWEVVSSGGDTTGATVGAGGREVISFGSTVAGVTVLSGGVLELDGGATATGYTIDSGGTLVLSADFSDPVPDGYLLNGYAVSAGVTLDVGGYASAVNITVSSGGVTAVGRTAIGTTVLSGGTLILWDATSVSGSG